MGCWLLDDQDDSSVKYNKVSDDEIHTLDPAGSLCHLDHCAMMPV
jgi:hypothetical protein